MTNNTTTNATSIATTVATPANAALAAGAALTAKFMLVLTGINIMSDKTTLSGCLKNDLKDATLDDVESARVTLTTCKGLLKEPIAKLQSIKKQVTAFMDQHGCRAGSSFNGGYFVEENEELIKDVVAKLFDFKTIFDQELIKIKGEWQNIIQNEVAQCNKIENDELRKISLSKIPSYEDFEQRCSFSPIFLNWAYSKDASTQALMSQGQTISNQNILDKFQQKVFTPFAEMKKDIEDNVRLKQGYKAEQIGKKFTALKKAVKKSLGSKFCLESIFKNRPELDLLKSAFDALNELEARFTGAGVAPKPVNEKQEKIFVKIIMNILDVFQNKASFEDWVKNNADIELMLGGYDIVGEGGKVSETLFASPEPKENEEEINVNVEEQISSLEDLFDANSSSEPETSNDVSEEEQTTNTDDSSEVVTVNTEKELSNEIDNLLKIYGL